MMDFIIAAVAIALVLVFLISAFRKAKGRGCCSKGSRCSQNCSHCAGCGSALHKEEK